MNKNEHTPTMYESIPAVAELNKVPGFNPLKLLRRVISPDNGETILQLDLPYKKLWFRLANPKGRIKLNALRITEQLAIFEAQVYLERGDENPVGSFTSSCTKEEAPGGQYIQAAQQAAMNEALSDAGYGVQFADVAMGAGGSLYGSRIPLNGISKTGEAVSSAMNSENQKQKHMPVLVEPAEKTLPVTNGTERKEEVIKPVSEKPSEMELPVQKKKSEVPLEQLKHDPEKVAGESEKLPVQSAMVLDASANGSLPVQLKTAKQPVHTAGELPVKASEPKMLPVTSETVASTEEKTSNVLPITGKTITEKDTQKAIQDMMALLGGQNQPAGKVTAFENHAKPDSGKESSGTEQVLPVSSCQTEKADETRYTPDMPVEEIMKLMTFEEAGKVVVDTGVCMGQTLTEVAERRPPSLKFYVYGGYKGDNNILRAAAKIMLDSLAAKKAG
ncbi:hypothetical protein [Enterocloster clostridioformis]|uniref:Uncharacterized protein n=1 Tax=Enterocloster clostridioformis TaxID=1531 RepID=A0A2X2W8V5_9FIRM|nr:hypothetical protein [Enterocloster clostridioformis]MCA5577308.1 hypothetical protein [Enterocloster clostridioformis]SQB10120.1 Uncharacterised protein [Enterocloster clostridioformis]